LRPTEPAHEPVNDVIISAAELLARVDPLPYPLRMRELALHARRLAGTSYLRVLLDDLCAEGEYGTRTALHMAMAGREIGFIEDVLAGPDMDLRRAALRGVRTLPVPDEAAAAALDDAPLDLRLALYRTLLHGRREALAEALLPDVHARWGDHEAAVLLPACGARTVTRWLPGLAHAVTSWAALGKRHPGAVLEVAHQELSTGTHAWEWWRRCGAGVELAALAEPSRMLALLEEHELRHQAARLSPPVLNALFRTDSARIAQMISHDTSWGWTGAALWLVRRMRARPESEILTLAPDSYRLDAFLRSLPPGRRGPVFDAIVRRRGGSTGLWAMHLLGVLPPERAAIEARRMLQWHASVWHSARSRLDDPELPLKLTSYLPYEEAAEALRRAAFTGDPRRRGLARTLLLECAARTGDRALFAALLADLARRTANEQDPLRHALLIALYGVAPRLLDDTCAEPLETLATHAAAARDSSAATQAALRRLAGRVLRHHDPRTSPALAAWALGVYEKLVVRHGAAGLGSPDPEPRTPPTRPGRGRRRQVRPQKERHRLDLVLRRGQEHDLFAVLRPCLRSARDRGEFGVAVALARVLGRRSWALGELQDDLRAAVRGAPEPIAREAAELWLAFPASREERVLDLLREEPSAVVLPTVWRMVAERRTDLIHSLDMVLESRFATSPWVPPVRTGMAGRWTPAQRGLLRTWLTSIADDDRTPAAARVTAIQAMGRIGGSLDRLVALADHEDTMPAEAALESMAGADDPSRALSVLLGHARERSSPVIVASLARCCRMVPPSLLGPALERALTDSGGKVSLRKQVVRQLERNRPPGALGLLLRTWEDPGLHRDVRVAVAGALRRMPEDPRALDALGAAADRYAGELMLRTLFQARPVEFAPAARVAYADLIRRLLAAADSPGVRFRGAKAFAAWATWYQGGYQEVVTATGDPEAADGETATLVFLALLRTGTIRSETLDVLSRLAAAVPLEGRTASMATPARDRVTKIAQHLAGMHSRESAIEPWQRRLTHDAVDVLAAEPLLLPEAVLIVKTALPAPVGTHAAVDPSALADGLCDLAEMLRDRPVLAAATAKELSSQRRYEKPVEPRTLLSSVRRLVDQGHLAANLLAVALTRVGGAHTDWAAEWRELLGELRASPDIEIRQEAWDVAVPETSIG